MILLLISSLTGFTTQCLCPGNVRKQSTFSVRNSYCYHRHHLCVCVCVWVCLCNDSLHTHMLLYMRTPDINTGDLPQPEYSSPYFLIQGFLLNRELLILLGWLANGPQGLAYLCLPSPFILFLLKIILFIKYMPPFISQLSLTSLTIQTHNFFLFL